VNEKCAFTLCALLSLPTYIRDVQTCDSYSRQKHILDLSFNQTSPSFFYYSYYYYSEQVWLSSLTANLGDANDNHKCFNVARSNNIL